MKKLLKFTPVIVVLALIISLAGCGGGDGRGGQENPTVSDTDKIKEVRNWVVRDIWNDGICDISHYIYDGTSATGNTMDIDFTLEQLTKAMEKKPDYDSFMAGLSAEYSEISSLWEKVSGQIDTLYETVTTQDLTPNGGGLDTGLYNQYFDAFDNALDGLDEPK